MNTYKKRAVSRRKDNSPPMPTGSPEVDGPAVESAWRAMPRYLDKMRTKTTPHNFDKCPQDPPYFLDFQTTLPRECLQATTLCDQEKTKNDFKQKTSFVNSLRQKALPSFFLMKCNGKTVRFAVCEYYGAFM